MANRFRGWQIVATAFVTLGLSVGLPYYNLPFFYDYFQSTFHWDLRQITLGFPFAALLTVWVGPLLVPRFSQRALILVGTALMALAFFGFGAMTGSITVYLTLYFLFTAGYIFAGPIPHQIIISNWFLKLRGRAMAFMYVGIGLFGGLGSIFVRTITAHDGMRTALFACGAAILLVWPLAIFLLRDSPAEYGEFPDGAAGPTAESSVPAVSYARLLFSVPFWLLLIGSLCSIAAVGAINMHMKFVFRDEGFRSQATLNAAWTRASVLILWCSIIGRLGVGYLADYFSKKMVMTATYFAVALSILLLLFVAPDRGWSLYVFAVVFGISMGADYFLIPLMAAEQFGLNTLARAMALILPVNTIGQAWCPYLVSAMREHYGNYLAPMAAVFAIAMVGAIAIYLLPRHARQLQFHTPYEHRAE